MPRRQRSRVALLTVLLAIALAALPGWAASISSPTSVSPSSSPAASAQTFRLVSYNILGSDTESAERLIEALVARAPAVVGLVEVAQSRADELAADPRLAELYPWQEYRPNAPNGGLAVLSSYPMEVQASDPWVPVIVTRVDVDGTPVAFIAAHAINPLRSSRRDAQLTAMRGLIDEQAAAGLPVVLAGDLNTNAFEPAFWPLSSGLTDVDAGATWGPDPNGPAILRIDHILTTPDLVPGDAAVDCDASASDHCLLEAVIGLGS
ncbi:MAG: endonuclease/exonuclease/phosphatase family protein [Chloroflexota bacterium]